IVELAHHTEQPLQLYIVEFERPYLESTRAYYANESNALISSMSVSEYMRKVKCESQFIAAHQVRIRGEFEAMIAQELFEDCSMTYSLLSRIANGVIALLDIFENFVAGIGKDVSARLMPGPGKDPREYVEALMELHAKYAGICVRVFDNDPAFTASLDKAFRIIMNEPVASRPSNAAEILARYCDLLLKKSLKGAEVDGEEKLTSLVTLFKYLDDKDVFQKFYSRMLAKRLILATYISDDSEMNMISRLKNACGVEYTSKLQRMFTDMAISNDLGLDFSIMVLTAGSWPVTAAPSSEFHMPGELEKSVTHFTTFYARHHSGRKLTWLYHLSKADVKMNHLDKRYELNVSLYQLGVLLLFNDAPTLTLRDLIDQSKLTEQDLRKMVKTFVDLKLVIPAQTEIGLETEIAINTAFTSKRLKIKVSSSMQTDTPQETDATRKAVEDDRRLFLQASL
ncbi:Cullin, partial [Blyttiomyces helicus]